MPTHAQIARRLTTTMGPGVFARAARDGVIHHDYTTLLRLFPGVQFSHRKTGPDEWELIGACEDGSTITWGVGE